jgi:zinc transport system substrate-binding protein
MKRTYLILLTILIALLLLPACGSRSSAPKDKPLIVTTIYPYELIVKQLVDTLFTVQTLLPAGASPHTWSPTPQDIQKLGRADMIVSNGLGLETNLDKTLMKVGSKQVNVSVFVAKNQLITSGDTYSEEHDDEEHHPHGDANPHIWTSPELLTQIIMGLSIELGKRYPMHKDYFDSNSRLMIMELNKTDSKIRLERDRHANPAVITLHDAFVYFFRYFKIDYIGAVQPSAGKDPAPRQLKELADKVRNKQIKAIFIEPQMNSQPAEVLANELNLQVLQYDDLGTTTDAKTISEYLLWNWNAIKAGL